MTEDQKTQLNALLPAREDAERYILTPTLKVVLADPSVEHHRCTCPTPAIRKKTEMTMHWGKARCFYTGSELLTPF